MTLISSILISLICFLIRSGAREALKSQVERPLATSFLIFGVCLSVEIIMFIQTADSILDLLKSWYQLIDFIFNSIKNSLFLEVSNEPSIPSPFEIYSNYLNGNLSVTMEDTFNSEILSRPNPLVMTKRLDLSVERRVINILQNQNFSTFD
jgi:hypothetical protein